MDNDFGIFVSDEDEELLPEIRHCWRCGSSCHWEQAVEGGSIIICDNAECGRYLDCGSYTSIEAAIADWNERPLEDVLRAERDALAQALLNADMLHLADEADVYALRTQLAAQVGTWQPVEDGQLSDPDDIRVEGEWLWMESESAGLEIASSLPENVRLCRRVPQAQATPDPMPSANR